MKRTSDYIGLELFIFQKSIWKREFEIKYENELIGFLRYPKIFSDLAEIEMHDSKLEFYRTSIFSRNVDIRKKGYQNPFAHFKSNFWGNKGILELPRGIRLQMKFGLMKKIAEVFYNERDLLFTIYSKLSLKEKSKIVIEQRSEIIDDYPWILILAFYLAQLRKRNSAAAG